MDLDDVAVFAKVAQRGSFTLAARELGMPKSTVSRRLSELEARLGARLLQRTTRRLHLTDAGRIYFERAVRIVEEVEDAARAVAQLQEAPRGLLRVTAPLSFAFLGAPIAQLLQRHPDLSVELVCTDRVVNLVDEGFDLGIRAGALADSSLIARSLGAVERFPIASPRYLARRGRPRRPRDLAKHDGLSFGSSRAPWRLIRGDETIDVDVPSRLCVNDFDVLREAAVAGLGIALMPRVACAAELGRKRLEQLLPAWSTVPTPVHAVYPSSRHLSPKVKALVEHLQAALPLFAA